MSDLNTSFTFRLTHADKAALADLAARLGSDRGAALRRMIRLHAFRTELQPTGKLTTRSGAISVRLMEDTQ